ncbi:hypothetical protein C8N36_10585 [Pelagimonas varians]|uniref:Uncharacterized protein n=1 Tax=Pelagimonas varians TaxID=696760 RepID=A0A238KAD4_9RHOB|nr:hypothetical protein C8N36_10585 [Pelagimonas varians]SMX39477.1 hypothetical protein PEV8663_01727 [Pelagimonas varians]
MIVSFTWTPEVNSQKGLSVELRYAHQLPIVCKSGTKLIYPRVCNARFGVR